MNEKLKACPFCGRKPKFEKSGAEAWIFCPNCGATQDSCETNKEAVDNWNSRQIEDKLHGKIGELEAENKRLIGALKAIKKIVDKPPLSIYEAARIYAECCEALGEKNDA